MNPPSESAEGRRQERRLFVGLVFPEPVREYLRRRCREWQESHALRGGRFARDFHVTLKFLGNVEEGHIAGVAKALEDAYTPFVAFPVTAGPLGAFPSPARVSVFWWGIGEGNSELVECAARTEDALDGVGFERERRPFVPHITLSRFRRTPDLRECIASENTRIETGEATAFPPFTATELALIESELRPQGALYTPLVSYSLS